MNYEILGCEIERKQVKLMNFELAFEMLNYGQLINWYASLNFKI